MSSIKGLKKEIGDLTYEVVSDCFTYILVNNDKNKDKVLKIISEAVSLRNQLISRLGHYEGERKARLVKIHYTKIREDLHTGMDKSFQKLSKLAN